MGGKSRFPARGFRFLALGPIYEKITVTTMATMEAPAATPARITPNIVQRSIFFSTASAAGAWATSASSSSRVSAERRAVSRAERDVSAMSCFELVLGQEVRRLLVLPRHLLHESRVAPSTDSPRDRRKTSRHREFRIQLRRTESET